MKLIKIQRTPNEPKEFKAVFDVNGRTKTTRFGTSSNFVLNPNKTIRDRTNYIKRHQVNEDFNDPTSAGALSRFVLWGDSRSLQKNISAFKKRFRL